MSASASAYAATAPPQPLSIELEDGSHVSALLQAPADARAGYVLAHGAGAGMAHPFMASIAGGLAARGVATLRFQFPSMERGSRRVDSPKVAHATVRSAVAAAGRHLAGLPLVAGGKSFGGRMTSQAQAAAALPGVRGLAFLGFPLHPAGRPSDERAMHLGDVTLPMLFLQGTNDDLADLALLRSTVERLGARATLVLFDSADHAFHVPAKSGRNDAEVREQLLDALARGIDAMVG